MQQIMDSLHTHLANPEYSKEDNQKIVDDNLDMLTKLIYKVFHTYRLVKKRTFSKTSKTADADRAAAPPELRALRLEANTARKLFVKLVKTEADVEAVAAAKKDWNRLTKCCRSVSAQVRSGFHMSWRTTWHRLQLSSPRKLWCTFPSLTRQTTIEPTCSPDQQWEHWGTQGDITDTVWNTTHSDLADAWLDELRQPTDSTLQMPAPTTEEISAARDRLRSGRAPGADGIPAEVIKRLSAIIAPITLLFTLMLRSATYPRSMGIALTRSLIKPGKPPGLVTSLRGIRLLCSMAAWFSHILDQRARQAWRAGKHQFGFKGNVGCMEAVAVLLALISSRTVKKQRLFVLWIDLRTAFPSLNRAILIRRLFSYGISIGFCRLLLAIFDRTVSVVCIGNLLGKQF